MCTKSSFETNLILWGFSETFCSKEFLSLFFQWISVSGIFFSRFLHELVFTCFSHKKKIQSLWAFLSFWNGFVCFCVLINIPVFNCNIHLSKVISDYANTFKVIKTTTTLTLNLKKNLESYRTVHRFNHIFDNIYIFLHPVYITDSSPTVSGKHCPMSFLYHIAKGGNSHPLSWLL